MVNKPLLGRRPPKIPSGGGPGPEIPPLRGPESPGGSISPLDGEGEEGDGSLGA
jgi:hypothetical protein